MVLITVSSVNFTMLLLCRFSQTFFGRTVFLKLSIGQFSDTQNPPVIVAECPKIFDVQCLWGRISSLLKRFLFLSIHRLYFIQVLHKIYMEKSVTRTFLGLFFWVPIPFKLCQNTSGCSTEPSCCANIEIKSRTKQMLLQIIQCHCIQVQKLHKTPEVQKALMLV